MTATILFLITVLMPFLGSKVDMLNGLGLSWITFNLSFPKPCKKQLGNLALGIVENILEHILPYELLCTIMRCIYMQTCVLMDICINYINVPSKDGHGLTGI